MDAGCKRQGVKLNFELKGLSPVPICKINEIMATVQENIERMEIDFASEEDGVCGDAESDVDEESRKFVCV